MREFPTSRGRYVGRIPTRAAIIGVFALLAIIPVLSSVPAFRQGNAEAASTPTFVQGTYARVSSGSSVSVAFSKPTTAGNTAVVYVLWGQSGTAQISDTLGDTYKSVSPATTWGNNANAQVFYATGLRAGSDTVTATFSAPVQSFALIYIHEYAGIDASNPVDVTRAASGNSGSINSGSVTTTSATDLLFMGAASDNIVTQPGTGYVVRSNGQGNMTADQVVATAGQYSATATQVGNAWVIQLVAFRGAGSTAPNPNPTNTPTATSSPTPTRTAIATNTSTPTATPTTAAPQTATPGFVQKAFNRVGSGSSVSAPFATANTTGNTILVYVVWSDRTSVSISDTNGNVYRPVSASLPWGGNWSAQMYYATGIAAGPNTVTAQFSAPISSFGLVYIHEYAGINTASPVDGTNGAVGPSGSLDSGPVTTTNARDLLFSAAASDNTVVSAGAGFTVRATDRGNMTADENVSTTGQYHATATQNGNAWVIQLVALRSASSGGTGPGNPTATPTSTPTSVGVTATPTSTPTSAPATATPTPTRTPTASPTPSGGSSQPAYPVKASSNGHYLVDQRGTPFLMAGDSPQSLIGNLSTSDADFYFANRQADGFNAAWVNLLCNDYTYCNSNGTTFDGIAPFTSGGDLSTPNPTYFSRADTMLQLAANHGILVILDPIETGGWLPTLRANGTSKAFAYGQFVGNRYKNQPNIVWLMGNDFQSWRTASDDALVQAVAQGIRSADPNHLITTELDFYVSASLDDSSWGSLLNMDGVYTYYPTYDKVVKEYNRASMPIWMEEANYEFEHNFSDQGTPAILRRQDYWTLLSGASGQLYGSQYTVRFQSGWKTNLDTPGAKQFQRVTNFFNARKWFNLVPDQNHTVVTAGYGTYDSQGSLGSNDYATTARTSDGTLVVSYLPTNRTVTVDMTKLAAPATARWFDPVSGNYTAISGSPLPNTGSRQFTPPGNNAEGSGDWVLVIETTPAP